jgi:hypothetical protein
MRKEDLVLIWNAMLLGKRMVGHEKEPARRSNTVTKIVRWDAQMKQPTVLFKVPIVRVRTH